MNGIFAESTAKIMIVDDSPENLTLLKDMLLPEGYEVLPFPSGPLALRAALRNPPDLILLDITMPFMNGYEVCSRLKNDPTLSKIPVIFLSALSATEDKVRAFRAGGVDYITKPFQFEEVRARVATHLKLGTLLSRLENQNLCLESLVAEKVQEIAETQLTAIFALAKLAESRDIATGRHLERVREYCRILAEVLGENSPYTSAITSSFVTDIQHSSPLHDIGKVAIPDRILLKPGELTEDEFAIMKSHTLIGAENLKHVEGRYRDNDIIRMGIDIALNHHERWNGGGYPHGLVGEEIPLPARIMAVADFYDALCSDRCYRREVDHPTVRSMIVERSGTQFDPSVVQAFLLAEPAFCDVRERLVDGHCGTCA